MLVCPICKKELKLKEHQFQCENHHCFDQSKEGYVNLSLKQKKESGDNAMMVKARTEFLNKDHYLFLRDAVVQKLQKYSIDSLLDAGCGQGYYTQAFSSVVSTCYGIDLSKAALKYASKHDRQSRYVVASSFQLPFSDASFDGLVTIFTPHANPEFCRVLKDKGIWIDVSPGPKHCLELKEVLYDEVYLNPMPSHEKQGFELVDEQIISQREMIHDLEELLDMTPYRYKTKPSHLKKIEMLDSLDITFEFLIRTWRKL